MNLQDLEHLMDQVRESCFRLESLPQYLVPQEAAEFAAWRAGSPRPRRTPQNNAWLAELEQIVARGIRWYRVRILDHPLTDYSRFELADIETHKRQASRPMSPTAETTDNWPTCTRTSGSWATRRPCAWSMTTTGILSTRYQSTMSPGMSE